MRRIREALRTLIPAVVIAAAVYFAADSFIARVWPEPDLQQETEESTEEETRPVEGKSGAEENDPEETQEEERQETVNSPGISGEAAEAETEESPEEAAEAETDGSPEDAAGAEGGYACSRLETEDRFLYRELYETVTGFAQETSLSVQDADRIERVFACVLADHPEIFYVDGYTLTTRTLGGDVQDVAFRAEYTFTQQQARERLLRVEEAADAVLSAVSEDMDDYEKLKLLYEAVVSGTEYDLQAPENQTICSVFLYGRSVCQGYAKAFQYLCLRAGIPAVLVTGTAGDGSPHAWTAVCCSGKWYYVDPAWGDVSYQMENPEEDGMGKGGTEDSGPAEQVDYNYFLVTTAQISLTHTADDTFPLPECVSMRDNYYVREGLYFTQADMEQAAEAFEAAQREERGSVTLKCADEAVYEALYEKLLTQQEVFRFLSDDTVSYAASQDQLTLTFFL